MRYRLTNTHIKKALDAVAKIDPDIQNALQIVGYPKERRLGSASYEYLLRIIVGQQLAVKAAQTIWGRVETGMGEVRPKNFLKLSDEALRGFGLSRQKIDYGRRLSQAVLDGFNPEDLIKESDEDVLAAITALKGFGRWSAEMFLMFSLGRLDVWPADDLAVQEGVRKIKGLKDRPKQKQMDIIAEPWRPHRSSVALLTWHFYSNAPL